MSTYSSLLDSSEPAYEGSRWWQAISELLLAVYELMWVGLWYQIMVPAVYAEAPLLNLLVLASVMLAAYLATKIMNALRLLRNVQYAVQAVILVIGLLVAEKFLVGPQMGDAAAGIIGMRIEAVYAALVVFWLWWRGHTLANDGIRPAVVWRRFRAGLVGFMFYLFYAVETYHTPPGLAWFMLFLFVGLLAMIFARIAYVGISKGAARNPFDRRWVLGISMILVVVVSLLGVAGSLFTGQYHLLSAMLELALRALWAIFIVLLAIPTILFAFLLQPVLNWLARLMAGVDYNKFTPQETPNPYMGPQQFIVQSPQAVFYMQATCFWVLLAALGVFLLWRLRKGYAEHQPEEQPQPESILERGEAARLLRQAVKDAMEDLRRRFTPVRRIVMAVRIRRIYADLLALCAELGCPRQPAVTPLEFSGEAGKLFPGQQGDLEAITQAYQLVRYGEYPETETQVRAVEAAWERIAEEGKRQKAVLKEGSAARSGPDATKPS